MIVQKRGENKKQRAQMLPHSNEYIRCFVQLTLTIRDEPNFLVDAEDTLGENDTDTEQIVRVRHLHGGERRTPS